MFSASGEHVNLLQVLCLLQRSRWSCVSLSPYFSFCKLIDFPNKAAQMETYTLRLQLPQPSFQPRFFTSYVVVCVVARPFLPRIELQSFPEKVGSLQILIIE
jgi:hypothetical protein